MSYSTSRSNERNVLRPSKTRTLRSLLSIAVPGRTRLGVPRRSTGKMPVPRQTAISRFLRRGLSGMMNGMAADAFIQFEHITKKFAGVTALDDVSLSIAKGECHGLM